MRGDKTQIFRTLDKLQQGSKTLSIFDNVVEIYANLDRFILISASLNKLDHFGHVMKNQTISDKFQPF